MAGSAAAEPCAAETYDGNGYVVCRFDLPESDVRLFWRQPDGTPYGAFSTLADALDKEGASLAFAMNGGMYGDDLTPIGLYVEGGKELRPVNTATVPTISRPRISTRSRTASSIWAMARQLW